MPAAAVAAGEAQPGWLIELGAPRALVWYHRGRLATPQEVWEAITAGLPTLRAVAGRQGPAAVADLERQIDRFAALVPAVLACEPLEA